MKNTELYQSLVQEFMDAFEQPCHKMVCFVSNQDMILRVALIEEEYKELTEANNDADRLDALCDLMYVVVGGACLIGTKLHPYSAPLRIKARHLPIVAATLGARIEELVDRFEAALPCDKKLKIALDNAARDIDVLGCTYYGYDIPGAFNVVHENNMKKLWSSEDLLDVPFGGTSKQKAQGYLIRNTAGKIIKPPGHRPPDLTPYLPKL